ncbi:MAG: TetR/AcrR family transcriptional regulator [Clostridiales bacterium]|nr:TetR/AcrR family transcriptional regulator [Clostridiales bacterium]
MDTKQKILDEALTLFSEKGYANVYVGDIADRVGIKAPSLYKHYKNKRAIFEAIIAEMSTRFLEQANALNIKGNDPEGDAGIYKMMSEESLIQLGTNLFLYYLHDDY